MSEAAIEPDRSATGGERPAAQLAPASVFAIELIAGFVRHGVTDIVVCPGSRSQALALAAATAERVGAVRLHVRIDERSAGFFALGIARETGIPAPVIVTSGSAVANLFPAAMEANEGRVPFIALTADRPQESRGIRMSQTTEQAHAFASAARLSLDVPAPEWGDDGDIVRETTHVEGSGRVSRDPAVLAATALSAATGFMGERPPGPVQLNLAFREPLSGTAGFDEMIAEGFEAAAEEAAEQRAAGSRAITDPGVRAAADGFETRLAFEGDDVYELAGDALTVVVAGAGAGDQAEAFAHMAGLPLIAEVVSGARFGREAIACYAEVLDAPSLEGGHALGALVERAIVFGHPTLTRQIPALLKRDDVEVVVVDPYGEADHYDPARSASVVRDARIAVDYDPRRMRRWLGEWVMADRALQAARSTVHEPDLAAAKQTGYKERNAYARAEVATMREPVTRELLVESVWRASWPHDRLVLAASRLVRVLDGFAPARKIRVHANRGLAGIDGTVALALGVAAASQGDADPVAAAGTTRAIIGDLALIHDAGSLALAPGEAMPRVQLFVGNDGGGTIFDGLEVAASADPEAYARVMRTPQQVDLAQLAAAYGWAYRLVATRGELAALLTEPVTGPCLIEVPLA